MSILKGSLAVIEGAQSRLNAVAYEAQPAGIYYCFQWAKGGLIGMSVITFHYTTKLPIKLPVCKSICGATRLSERHMETLHGALFPFV